MVDIDFERLVEEFYMPLYRFGLSLSRNEADACDLVQHTFHAWAAKGHQLRDASRVKTWLFTTLYRHFLATKRHADRFVDFESDEVQLVEPPQVAPSAVSSLDAALVQQALQELEDRYRAPVTLFYMQQHSYREIAEILEIPIGTVMSRISRGKAQLRERVSEIANKETHKLIPFKEERADGR